MLSRSVAGQTLGLRQNSAFRERAGWARDVLRTVPVMARGRRGTRRRSKIRMSAAAACTRVGRSRRELVLETQIDAGAVGLRLRTGNVRRAVSSACTRIAPLGRAQRATVETRRSVSSVRAGWTHHVFRTVPVMAGGRRGTRRSSGVRMSATAARARVRRTRAVFVLETLLNTSTVVVDLGPSGIRRAVRRTRFGIFATASAGGTSEQASEGGFSRLTRRAISVVSRCTQSRNVLSETASRAQYARRPTRRGLERAVAARSALVAPSRRGRARGARLTAVCGGVCPRPGQAKCA